MWAELVERPRGVRKQRVIGHTKGVTNLRVLPQPREGFDAITCEVSKGNLRQGRSTRDNGTKLTPQGAAGPVSNLTIPAFIGLDRLVKASGPIA